MQSLSLQPSAAQDAPDLALEVERLEALLAERRAELIALQEALRDFKLRYTQQVGSRLVELAEVEREVREAETRSLGVEAAEEEDASSAHAGTGQDADAAPVKTTLRKLFWSVARMFHPDHAADEGEARRRHSIMAEASRAYREGDAESLHTLLGDEQLQSYCATAQSDDAEPDIAGKLLNLREELRTTEFGLKRIRQDRLYQLKLSVDEEAAHGRDKLAQEAARIDRQIAKARRRLEHLS